MNLKSSPVSSGRALALGLAALMMVALAPLAHAQKDATAPNPVANWVSVDDQIVPAYAVRGATQTPGGNNGPLALSTPTWANKWPGGRVAYAYDPSMSAAKRAIFESACREWEKYANLRFAPRTSQANYINVVSTVNSSNSYIGMIGGAQTLNLADWADKFTSMHEIAHALGVIHEQSRPGRDTYVTIHTENIESGYESNFSIVDGALNQGPYDFDSFMHYPATAFSINGQPTIVANPGYTQFQNTMGQRNHTSALDASGMAAIYGAAQTIALVSPAQGGTFGAATTLRATTAYAESGATVEFAARPAPVTIGGTPNINLPSSGTSNNTNSASTSASGSVVNAILSVDISHSYRGDLRVSLIAPDGTSSVVQSYTGLSGANLRQSYDVSSAIAGKSIAGTWTVRVEDLYDQDGGTWNSWSLVFSQSYATVATDTDGPDSAGQYTATWNASGLAPGTYQVRARLTAGDFSAEAANVAQYVATTNRAPVATARSFSTFNNQNLTGTLTGTDPDGDALTFAKASDPAHGSVTVNANGAFTYTPVSTYAGSDSFKFTASDGQANSAPATVSITVKQANRAPVLNDVSFNATQNSAFSRQLAGTDADGDTLSYSVSAGTLNAGLSLSNSGLLSGTPTQSGTRVFTVVVSDGKGGTDSAQITVNVATVNLPPELKAPTGLTASASTGAITLNWTDNSTDETGYKVERRVGSGKWVQLLRGEAPNQTSYVDTNVTAATTYSYRVRAYKSGFGNGAYSNVATATAPQSNLAAPSNLLAVVGADQTSVKVTWRDNASIEDGHKVERRLSTETPWAEIARVTPANATSYLDSGVNAGATYVYRVRAYKTRVANGDYSGEATVSLPESALGKPSGVSAFAASNGASVTLAWTDNATIETGYKVERKGADGRWNQILVGSTPNQTSFIDTGVTPGQTYSYRVRAYKYHYGNSDYSDEVTVATPNSEAPGGSGGLS